MSEHFGLPVVRAGGLLEDLSVIVIPARDEQDRIPSCLAALAIQTVSVRKFEVILVEDACRDDTVRIAQWTAARLGLKLQVLHGQGLGPGPARRLGMGAAADRLRSLRIPHGLIASTDADTRPTPDWLERQLVHVAGGAQVIAGYIELEPAEAAGLPAAVLEHRQLEAARRLRVVHATEPDAAHHHFGGASIGVTAQVYRSVGGLPAVTDLEDEAFARRLLERGISITRPADVRVVTAARTIGRARRGLAADLARAVDLSEGTSPE